MTGCASRPALRNSSVHGAEKTKECQETSVFEMGVSMNGHISLMKGVPHDGDSLMKGVLCDINSLMKGAKGLRPTLEFGRMNSARRFRPWNIYDAR